MQRTITGPDVLDRAVALKASTGAMVEALDAGASVPKETIRRAWGASSTLLEAVPHGETLAAVFLINAEASLAMAASAFAPRAYLSQADHALFSAVHVLRRGSVT